jgi:site-specific recombinase XerD
MKTVAKPFLPKGKLNYLVLVEQEPPRGREGMESEVVISEYQNHLKALGYAKTTVNLYQTYLGQFKRYLVKIKVDDLRQVSKKIIQDYKAEIMAEKNARETKALKLRPVKRLFEYLVENNKLFLNPTEGLVETCRKNRKIGVVLTVAEVQKLMEQPNLSYSMEIRNRAIMEVFYTTGMRLNELILLMVHDVDFKEKVVYIRKAKGGKQRVVPLGKTAIQFLREYLDRTPEREPCF